MCADIGHCDRNTVFFDWAFQVGVMCADIGHCDDVVKPAPFAAYDVGVMCADIGHCDPGFSSGSLSSQVGVMCADIGHCDKDRHRAVSR